MTEIILKLIIAVFCVLGVAEVVHILKQKILAPEHNPETSLVIYLNGDTPDLQLASIINEYNWYRRLKPKKIIGVYSVIDELALENCRRMAERHNIYLIPLDESDDRNDFNLV